MCQYSAKSSIQLHQNDCKMESLNFIINFYVVCLISLQRKVCLMQEKTSTILCKYLAGNSEYCVLLTHNMALKITEPREHKN